jgi:hypothetical protein
MAANGSGRAGGDGRGRDRVDPLNDRSDAGRRRRRFGRWIRTRREEGETDAPGELFDGVPHRGAVR